MGKTNKLIRAVAVTLVWKMRQQKGRHTPTHAVLFTEAIAGLKLLPLLDQLLSLDQKLLLSDVGLGRATDGGFLLAGEQVRHGGIA